MSEPSTSGASPIPPTPPTAQPSYIASRYASLKANLRKYGKTGIAVYLGLSTCVTAGFYIAIEEHLDVTKFLGIKDGDPNSEPTFFEKMVTGKGSSLALAMLCSKAMVPIKLPVAVAITPYVHRFTQGLMQKVPATAAAGGNKGL
mmetsp:Transcript_26513/g.67435  ORF Transcript_26513/g.67435 Transcript_26513/m.67435 type:complete len:145 (-) Transcript_26513:367-801(-)